MLQEAFLDHVVSTDIGFLWELVPEFEVLVKLCPALWDSCRDETEEIVQEVENQQVFRPLVFSSQCELLVSNVVTEWIGKEVGYVSPHIDLWIFNQQWHKVGILSNDLSEPRRIFFNVHRERVKQLLEAWRLQPKSKSQLLAKFDHLFWVILGQNQQFCKELGETSGG